MQCVKLYLTTSAKQRLRPVSASSLPHPTLKKKWIFAHCTSIHRWTGWSESSSKLYMQSLQSSCSIRKGVLEAPANSWDPYQPTESYDLVIEFAIPCYSSQKHRGPWSEDVQADQGHHCPDVYQRCLFPFYAESHRRVFAIYMYILKWQYSEKW